MSDSNVAIQEIDVQSSNGDTALSSSAAIAFTQRWADAFEATIDASLYDTRYSDLSAFDVNTQLLSANFAYELNSAELGVSVYRANSTLDGEKFLTVSHLQPSVSGFIQESLYYRLGYGIESKRFFIEEGREADRDSLAGDLYYFLSGSSSYLSLGLRVFDEDSDNDFFDYSGNSIKLAWIKKTEVFSKSAKFNVGISVAKQDYAVAADENGQKQKEDHLTLYSRLHMNLSESVYVEFAYEYFDSQSNVAELDYDQNIIESVIGVEF